VRENRMFMKCRTVIVKESPNAVWRAIAGATMMERVGRKRSLCNTYPAVP
jgi:hypothetical protein